MVSSHAQRVSQAERDADKDVAEEASGEGLAAVGGQQQRSRREDKLKGPSHSPSRINRAQLIEVLDRRGDEYSLTDEEHEEHLELIEEHLIHNHPTGDQTAAVMIWLGILIDAIPESLVLGILANSGNVPSLVTFTCGVFVANFPEALSSSATMHACGIRKRTILLMWCVIWLGSACLGAEPAPLDACC